MKKQLLTLLLFAHFVVGFSQWVQISSGTLSDLQDVHFPSDSVGYIVGYYGITLRSTDMGSSWDIVHKDSAKTFHSVFFIDENTGFAAGGSLYKTNDGGVNWEEVMTDTFDQIIEVYFVNDSLGFAGGTKLHITRDGGQTWNGQDLGNAFSAIHFPSDSVGYFIGGSDFANPLYKTTDAGQSFVTITNGFQSIKESVYFLNDDTGYMCGWYAGIIAKTTNGGETWQLLDHEGGTQCWAVHFIDESIGYYIDNSGGTHLIKKTKDGGATWNTQLLNTDVGLYGLYFIDPNTIIAVGSNGSIFKTTNGGEVTATSETDPAKDISIYPNPAINDLYIDNRTGSTSGYSIGIYTSLGQEVLNSLHIEKNVAIDVSNLSSGVYCVVISDDQGVKAVKRILKMQ